uniref:Uncharacterized protein n=1 Tax=Anopheles farauti TaxID=69004 RepID=A0A182PZB8_9DIPT
MEKQNRFEDTSNNIMGYKSALFSNVHSAQMLWGFTTRCSGTARDAIGRPTAPSSPPDGPPPSPPLPAASSSVGVGIPRPLGTAAPFTVPFPVDELRLRGTAGPRSSSVWKMSTDAGTNRITLRPPAGSTAAPFSFFFFFCGRLVAADDTLTLLSGAANPPKSNGDDGGGGGFRRRAPDGSVPATAAAAATLSSSSSSSVKLSYSNSSGEAVAMSTDHESGVAASFPKASIYLQRAYVGRVIRVGIEAVRDAWQLASPHLDRGGGRAAEGMLARAILQDQTQQQQCDHNDPQNRDDQQRARTDRHVGAGVRSFKFEHAIVERMSVRRYLTHLRLSPSIDSSSVVLPTGRYAIGITLEMPPESSESS